MALIFDSHAHYDNERFADDLEQVLSAMPQKGVGRIMNVASDIESCISTPKLAEQYDFVYATVGIHPHTASTLDHSVLDLMARQAANPKVRAIGEIGLDYYYDLSPRDQQVEAFIKQLEFAHDLKMPVVIHSRDAHQETLNILKKYRPTGIVHCFSGSAELAEEMVKLGLYIGFTGVVTFQNAKKALLAAAATPLDRLLIETDCPYMAPVPHRGERCDSSMLTLVATKLAEIKGLSTEQLLTATWDNANRIYEIQD